MKRLLFFVLTCWAMGTAALVQAQVTTDAWRPVSFTSAVKVVAIGGRGHVGVIDASGNVWRKAAGSLRAESAWQQIGTGMVRLAVDATGGFWAVDTQGTVRRLEGNNWRAVGSGASAIAAAADGSMVVATNAATLARYDPGKSSWTALPGSGSRVAVDAQNLIWVVGADGAMARRLDNAWIGVTGQAIDIAADALGNVLMVGRDGKLYEWAEATVRWSEQPGVERAASVAVGAGQVWRIDTDGKLYAKGIRVVTPDGKVLAERPKSSSGSSNAATIPSTLPIEFVKVASSTALTDLSIGSDGSVYGLNAAGAIQRWSNAERRFNAFPGTLRKIEVNQLGLPLGVSDASTLLRHDGVAWRKINLPFGVFDVSFAGVSSTLAIGADTQLYRLDIKDDNASTVRLVGNVEQAVAAPDGGFWYRNTAGLLFQCDKSAACERRGLSTTDIAIGPGGTVFVVDNQSNLHRYNKQIKDFEILRKGTTVRVALGPGDRPWVIEKNGDVLASQQFARNESGDILLARATEATASVTRAEPVLAATGLNLFNFLSVDVPISAPGFPNLGAGLLDVTVGLDDQIIVTGFDATADPCRSRADGWKGRNWIYNPALRTFVHLDYLKRVQFQMAIAGRAVTLGTAPPALAGAPAVPAFYGLARACTRYHLNEYDAATFNGMTNDFFDVGGLAYSESNLRSNQVTADTRNLTTVLDMDMTLDNWILAIFPERRINFIGIGSNESLNPSGPFPTRDDQKFARIGVGANRNVLWATSFESDVYEFVAATNKFEKRNIFATDKAQDIGVGKDGSVFIVDITGRLKKWDAQQKVFFYAGKSGVTRVAVTSKGKPVVANFPSSQRIFIGQ
jgi:hypothetical protein